MKKVCLIIGARPNFMKAFPVYEALKDDFDITLIHTGQHFDAKMSDVFFNQLKFPKPDIHLSLDKKTKSGDFDDKLYDKINEKFPEARVFADAENVSELKNPYLGLIDKNRNY